MCWVQTQLPSWGGRLSPCGNLRCSPFVMSLSSFPPAMSGIKYLERKVATCQKIPSFYMFRPFVTTVVFLEVDLTPVVGRLSPGQDEVTSGRPADPRLVLRPQTRRLPPRDDICHRGFSLTKPEIPLWPVTLLWRPAVLAPVHDDRAPIPPTVRRIVGGRVSCRGSSQCVRIQVAPTVPLLDDDSTSGVSCNTEIPKRKFYVRY